MIINKCGIYKTNIEYKGGNACSVWTIPSSTEFKVTQIDITYHKFLSNIFGEWSYWDKDVVWVGEKAM
jgi:hypothetical protein